MRTARYGAQDSTGKMASCASLRALLVASSPRPRRRLQRPIPAPPDVAAPPADAAKTASGLATKVLTPGTGKDHPAKDDLVTVHYTGWTTDGKMFDSSVTRGKPATFRVNRVIAGFSEGLQLMVPGEKRRLWIPEALAYKGSSASRKGMLVFDVELIGMPNRAAGRREGAAGRREENGERPRLQGADAGHRRPPSEVERTRSRSTTPAGRRTARCSTARSSAASRRHFRSTASSPDGPKACS